MVRQAAARTEARVSRHALTHGQWKVPHRYTAGGQPGEHAENSGFSADKELARLERAANAAD